MSFIYEQIINVLKNPRVIITWIVGYLTNKLSKYFVEIEKDCYTVHYPYGVRWYRIRIPKVQGPTPYISKITADDIDVTDNIKQLMGPSHNFHNQPVSPESLGYKKIIFEYALEEPKEFVNDDTIILI
jgi:hypothetical protein